jgi:hypothetical protein
MKSGNRLLFHLIQVSQMCVFNSVSIFLCKRCYN